MYNNLEKIADLINDGYTYGQSPNWVLNSTWEDEITDIGLKFISSQLKEGYMSGSSYDEIIGLKNWSIDIDEVEELTYGIDELDTPDTEYDGYYLNDIYDMY